MRTVQQFVTLAHADRVSKVLADVEHWQDWNPAIMEIRPLTNDGLRTGARYRVNPAETAAGRIRGNGMHYEVFT
jgi:hypothetical protein